MPSFTEYLDSSFKLGPTPILLYPSTHVPSAVSNTTSRQGMPPARRLRHAQLVSDLARRIAQEFKTKLFEKLQLAGDPQFPPRAAISMEESLDEWTHLVPADYNEATIQQDFRSTVLSALLRAIREVDQVLAYPRAGQPQISTQITLHGGAIKPDLVFQSGVTRVGGGEFKPCTASRAPSSATSSDTGMFRAMETALQNGNGRVALAVHAPAPFRSMLHKAILTSDTLNVPTLLVLDGYTYFVVAGSATDQTTVLVSDLMAVGDSTELLYLMMDWYYDFGVTRSLVNELSPPAVPHPVASSKNQAGPSQSAPLLGGAGSSYIDSTVSDQEQTRSGRGYNALSADLPLTISLAYPNEDVLGLRLVLLKSPTHFSPSPTPPSLVSPPSPDQTPPTSDSFHETTLASIFTTSPTSRVPSLPLLGAPTLSSRHDINVFSLPPTLDLEELLASGLTSRAWGAMVDGSPVVVKTSRYGQAEALQHEAQLLLTRNLPSALVVPAIALYRLETVNGEDIWQADARKELSREQGKVVLVMEFGGTATSAWGDLTAEQRTHLFLSLVRLHQEYHLLHNDPEPRNTVRLDPHAQPRWIDLAHTEEDHECAGRSCEELANVFGSMFIGEEERERVVQKIRQAGLEW